MPKTVGALTYYPRSEWGARYGTGRKISRAVGLVVVHHAWKPDVPADIDEDGIVVGDLDDIEAEKKAMRGMEHYHSTPQPGKDWIADGISYQWCIFQSGRVYEGRGWRRTGAHTKGENSRSLGVCFVMNGDKHKPSEDAVASFNILLWTGWELGHVERRALIRGHRDFSPKKCPGQHVYAAIVLPLNEHPT